MPGAWSLALGGGGRAVVGGLDALWLNPARLSDQEYGAAGYLYMHGNADWGDPSEVLENVLRLGPSRWDELDVAARAGLSEGLRTLAERGYWFCGHTVHAPVYLARGYGLAYAREEWAVWEPLVETWEGIDGEWSPESLEQARVRASAFRVNRLTFAYAVNVSAESSIGFNLHYLNGKMDQRTYSLTDTDVFMASRSPAFYNDLAGADLTAHISKVVGDMAMTYKLGPLFRAAFVWKNIGSPVLKGDEGQVIKLDRRMILSLAAASEKNWLVAVDVDVRRSERLGGGGEIQPLSVGIEKSMMQGQFRLRAGISTDLAQDHVLGDRSPVTFHMGMGAMVGGLVLDGALVVDPKGRIEGLSVGGQWVLR